MLLKMAALFTEQIVREEQALEWCMYVKRTAEALMYENYYQQMSLWVPSDSSCMQMANVMWDIQPINTIWGHKHQNPKVRCTQGFGS